MHNKRSAHKNAGKMHKLPISNVVLFLHFVFFSSFNSGSIRLCAVSRLAAIAVFKDNLSKFCPSEYRYKSLNQYLEITMYVNIS